MAINTCCGNTTNIYGIMAVLFIQKKFDVQVNDSLIPYWIMARWASDRWNINKVFDMLKFDRVFVSSMRRASRF